MGEDWKSHEDSQCRKEEYVPGKVSKGLEFH